MILKQKITTNEHCLTPEQLEYFRERLLKLKHEFEEKLKKHSSRIQEESVNEPDSIDRASAETNRSLEVQARDQERGLIFKINQALERISDGTYGFCKETGVPIGLPRLEAYPIATLCVEAQELSERLKRAF